MPRLAAKHISEGARFSVGAYEKEIRNYLRRRVKPEIRKRLEAQVENFEHRPQFRVRVTGPGPNPSLAGGYGIALDAWPVGPHAALWRMLSAGAPEHLIPDEPKGAGSWLVYQKNYEPKTEIVGEGLKVGGSGAYSGPIVKKKQVTHPGFQPRRWGYYLMEEYRKTWNAHVEGVLREAMQAARRAR